MKYYAKKEITKDIKTQDILVPLYRKRVELLFHPHSLKLEKDWEKDVDGASAQTRNYCTTQGKVIICFYEKTLDISTVVHELTHATQMILHHAGHDHCQEDADEPFAYLLTYLVEEFFKVCKKQKITLKKS